MELMDRAANRFDGAKRDMMLAAKSHFAEMLAAEVEQASRLLPTGVLARRV